MESAAHGKSANKIHFFTDTSTWSDYSKTVPAMYTSKNFTANNDGLPSKIIHRKHQLSTASWHNRKLKIRRNVVVITWLLFAFGFCARRGLSREMLTPPLLMQNSPVDTHKSHTRSICKHHTHTHTHMYGHFLTLCRLGFLLWDILFCVPDAISTQFSQRWRSVVVFLPQFFFVFPISPRVSFRQSQRNT